MQFLAKNLFNHKLKYLYLKYYFSNTNFITSNTLNKGSILEKLSNFYSLLTDNFT